MRLNSYDKITKAFINSVVDKDSGLALRGGSLAVTVSFLNHSDALILPGTLSLSLQPMLRPAQTTLSNH